MREVIAPVTMVRLGRVAGLRQIGARGALAVAVGDRHLDPRNAFLRTDVRIVDRGVAGRDRGLLQRVVVHVGRIDLRDLDRSAVAVMFAGAAPTRLQPLEIGQHVGIAPACQPALPPQVIVARIAAHIDHAVDAGRAAERLAARNDQPAAVERRLGFALVVPAVGSASAGLWDARSACAGTDAGRACRPPAAARKCPGLR